MAIFSQLRRRRVPQFMGIYLGASWAVIQFVDWMTEQYLLSRHLTDLALLILVSLMPAVLLLAYYHGAPGRQPLGRFGKVGVPVNVLVTLGLVGMFLQGHDLSAAAKNVTVTDEDGQQVTRLVAADSARRKVALFFWANDSGDDELEWLRYGLPMVLARDLDQNPFVDPWTPRKGYGGGGIFSRLVRAGYADGLGAPVALQRKITADWHLGYFVDGRFDHRDGQLTARISVYRVDGGEPETEHEVAAATATELADALTVLLVADLDVPAGNDRLVPDLPAGDILTTDTDALRAYVAARRARLMRNDTAAAIDHLQQAVTIDASFAAAQFLLGDTLFQNGDTEAADEALAEALRHDYKLLEEDRFQVKGYRYVIDGQVEKQTALYEMWADLHPTDVTALASLASVYMWSGNRVADAKRVFEQLLASNPIETWVLSRLAGLAQLEGDTEGALRLLERYTAHHPEDLDVWLQIGIIDRGEGDLDGARDAFEKASMMATGKVNPALLIADLEMRLGNFDETEARLDEADGIAADSGQRAAVLKARIDYYKLRGRFEEGYALLEPLDALERQVRQPVDVFIIVHANNVELYHETGRDAELGALTDAAIERFGAPLDRFLAMGHMLLAVVREDADNIERYRLRLEEVLASWKREDLRFLTEMARAHELRLRGQGEAAITAFEGALSYFSHSVQSGGRDLLTVELRRQIAITRRQMGDLDAAEEAVGKALPLMPTLPTLHLELAKIADARGHQAEAREHARRALDVWTDADEGYEPAAEARALAAHARG